MEKSGYLVNKLLRTPDVYFARLRSTDSIPLIEKLIDTRSDAGGFFETYKPKTYVCHYQCT
jgi:hypothetical protein